MSQTNPNPAVKAYLLLIRVAKPLQCIFLLAIRITWGWQFFEAGKGKLENLHNAAGFFAELHIPLPYFSALLASCTECFGGLLLIAGLGARLISVPLTITKIVAYLTAHRGNLVSVDEFVKAAPFPFLFTSLVVLCFGPGKVSIDYLIQRFVLKNRKSETQAL
jgi:putative oxidoreductase